VPNEVFEVVRTLLAVREYDDRAITPEAARRIVEAGYLTASGGNVQPWHFVLVRNRDSLRRLGSLVRTGPYVAGSAAAVIVAYEKEKGEVGISDASRAIQSMMLAAWGEGVASNWTGFAHRLDNVRQEFGLPETYDVLCVIPLGYPRRKIIGRKKRKPFSQVVSAERYGQALE
jgi:nitroreductase